MAYQFSIDSERGVVKVSFTGKLGSEDVAEYLVSLQFRPDFQPTYSELVDVSAVAEVNLSMSDLEYLSSLDPFFGGVRRAFIATAGNVFASCRMYKLISKRPNIEIFKTHAEAVEWLAPSQG